MKKKRLIIMVFFAMIIMHCEDNNDAANVGSNCGLETTFIKDIDNIVDTLTGKKVTPEMIDSVLKGWKI